MVNRKDFLILQVFILTILTLMFFPPINLTAMTYGTISGSVVDEITGKGVEGIIVTINLENRQINTDKNGFFKFEKVPAEGEYEIMVFIDKEPHCTQTYELNVRLEKRKDVILEDIIAKRGGAIEGTIKQWNGTPITDLSVTVYIEDELPGVYGGITDKDGSYRVSRLPPDTDLTVIAACWNVAKGCGRIVKKGIRVERDKTTTGIDFIVPDNPTEIYGKVTSRDGEPLRAHLTFWKDSEDTGNLTCDLDGSYSIVALKPGNYRIHVGYGNEKMKISGDKKIFVTKGKKYRIDIIISEKSIEFKEHKNPAEAGATPNDFFFENNDDKSLAELKFSRNEAFNENLKELITDAYFDDVAVRVKSDCLPDGHPESIRIKLLNRLFNASKPIFIVIRNKDKPRLVEQKGRFYRIRQCGGTPKGSNVIYVRPVTFTGECGSLASILFHELIHVIGMKDDIAYSATKKCYGDEALDAPISAKKR